MGLKTTPVSKCLDKKMLIMGYEIPDLLTIFLLLSLLNFIFGQSNYKLALVWAPTAGVALLLRIAKRGRPDGYLVHWLRFQVKPGIWSAFADPAQPSTPLKRQKGRA